MVNTSDSFSLCRCKLHFRCWDLVLAAKHSAPCLIRKSVSKFTFSMQLSFMWVGREKIFWSFYRIVKSWNASGILKIRVNMAKALRRKSKEWLSLEIPRKREKNVCLVLCCRKHKIERRTCVNTKLCLIDFSLCFVFIFMQKCWSEYGGE